MYTALIKINSNNVHSIKDELKKIIKIYTNHNDDTHMHKPMYIVNNRVFIEIAVSNNCTSDITSSCSGNIRREKKQQQRMNKFLFTIISFVILFCSVC